MTRSLLFLLLVLFQVIDGAGFEVDPLTTFLRDEYGRNVFFHGMNVVYKEFPYLPSTETFNPHDSLANQDF